VDSPNPLGGGHADAGRHRKTTVTAAAVSAQP
jgi:hypothetical protein